MNDNDRVFTALGLELGCYSADTGEKLWNLNGIVDSQNVFDSGPTIADGKFFLLVVDTVPPTKLMFTGRTRLPGDNLVKNTSASPAYKGGVLHLTTTPFMKYGRTLYLRPLKRSNPLEAAHPTQRGTPAFASTGGIEGYADLQNYCFNASPGALVWQTPSLPAAGAASACRPTL